jgi:hypothetical protein
MRELQLPHSGTACAAEWGARVSPVWRRDRGSAVEEGATVIQFGYAVSSRQEENPQMQWVAFCTLADLSAEYAGTFATREEAVAQAEAWLRQYPESRAHVLEPKVLNA